MRPTIIDVVDGPRIMAFSHCCPSSQILEHASAIGRFGYNLSGYRIFRPPSTTNHVTSPPHSPTMIFQILDVNRVCDPDGFPTVQLFGTTPPNRPVTAHASGFCPNFCVWVDEKRIEAAILEVKSMGLSDEAVERFRLVGYRRRPQKMPKGKAKNPKSVREFRVPILPIPPLLVKDPLSPPLLAGSPPMGQSTLGAESEGLPQTLFDDAAGDPTSPRRRSGRLSSRQSPR